MWAPLTPPATYTPNVTARPQPQPMISQSPLAAKICVPRPDWLRAATAMATTPSPKEISTKMPRNSARSSPQVVCRQDARLRGAVAPAAISGRRRDVLESLAGLPRRELGDLGEHGSAAAVDLIHHAIRDVGLDPRIAEQPAQRDVADDVRVSV